ncbi:hypothetical protein NCLIV_038600 [Neospora caninum Liverpool]|uniref:Cyclin-U4-1 n=1 Tax=Neospora caninum (strain Liverpool) TaxID=572307 RepID=F0VAN0_NEOCL|nr:hypothetical protein NCLIV_038600 [Neospora caninum Liverpool]CBZ50785.1 hypothetical protein NCLIV_038600 [Neospora caninum Liverpool]CEL68086.1 TPA: Cyclin-U4-1 [Neospora caninum Liverpool]|eukprot:XP_003880818.1 hypothetical protein NCLIV_038600 [Neospora caninum Liverpool]
MDRERYQEGTGQAPQAAAAGGSSYSTREQSYTSVSSYDRQMGAEASSTDDSFVPSLATVLHHLVSISPPGLGEITSFHAIKEPQISIHDYLDRIAKYFGCSNECFVLSLVYIDRIIKLHRNFNVSILNIHRLLITSVMLAAKFFDDVYYSNKHYARVGGVRTREMNLLETQFLTLINYHLYVSPQEYDQYRRNVLAAVHYARHLTPSPLASNRLSSSQSSTSTASSSVSQTGNSLGNGICDAPSQALTNATHGPLAGAAPGESAESESAAHAGGPASGAAASSRAGREDRQGENCSAESGSNAPTERRDVRGSLRTVSNASPGVRQRGRTCLSRQGRRGGSQDASGASGEERLGMHGADAAWSTHTPGAVAASVYAASACVEPSEGELESDESMGSVCRRDAARAGDGAVPTAQQEVEHEMEEDRDEDAAFAEEGVAYGDATQAWEDDLAEEELYGEGTAERFTSKDDEWDGANVVIAAEKNATNETPAAECGRPSVVSYGNRFHPSSQPFRGVEDADAQGNGGKYGYFCASASSTKVSFSTASAKTLASPAGDAGLGAGTGFLTFGARKAGPSTPSHARTEARSASAGLPAGREASCDATAQGSPAVFYSPAHATGCCRSQETGALLNGASDGQRVSDKSRGAETSEPAGVSGRSERTCPLSRDAEPRGAATPGLLQPGLGQDSVGARSVEAVTPGARLMSAQTRGSSGRSRDGEERVMEMLECCSSQLLSSFSAHAARGPAPGADPAVSESSAPRSALPPTGASGALSLTIVTPSPEAEDRNATDFSSPACRDPTMQRDGRAGRAVAQPCLTPSGDGASSASTASGGSNGTTQSSVSSCLTPSHSVHSSPDVSMEEETGATNGERLLRATVAPGNASVAGILSGGPVAVEPRLAPSHRSSANEKGEASRDRQAPDAAGLLGGPEVAGSAGMKAASRPQAPVEQGTAGREEKAELERMKPRDAAHVHWIDASDFAGAGCAASSEVAAAGSYVASSLCTPGGNARGEFLALGGSAPHAMSCRKGGEHEAAASFSGGLSLSAGLAPAGASRGICFSFGPCS